MKKISRMLLLVFFLSIIYSYTLGIENIPNDIVIFEGENIEMRTLLGIGIKETIETGANSKTQKISEINGNSEEKSIYTNETNSSKNLNVNTKTLEVSIFDKIKLKDIGVSVLPKTTVIPLGNIAGVKLYTNGVLVVGMSEIEGNDNKKYKPYEHTGITEGDTIVKIDNQQIDSTKDLIETVNRTNGKEVKVEYIHAEETKECSIQPVKTGESEYKLGLWVRDSAAGVGTVTFYEPSSKSFGALGHGITDIDTNELINIASGEFITTRILNITKGERGEPGKIQGTIENQANIGTISKNSRYGIYGQVKNLSGLNIDMSKEMEVATRDEIQIGKASILCSLDNQKPKEYEIEIKRIYKDNNYDNKSMEIKVTDEELINKTGGIIQGMSGSPVIQNGKFIGAVTHVLVNEPKEGYAVFGDIMLKQLKEVN